MLLREGIGVISPSHPAFDARVGLLVLGCSDDKVRLSPFISILSSAENQPCDGSENEMIHGWRKAG